MFIIPSDTAITIEEIFNYRLASLLNILINVLLSSPKTSKPSLLTLDALSNTS